ncbi:MAG: hypothetical protein WD069_15420 [Planctomycetales bacterium]
MSESAKENRSREAEEFAVRIRELAKVNPNIEPALTDLLAFGELAKTDPAWKALADLAGDELRRVANGEEPRQLFRELQEIFAMAERVPGAIPGSTVYEPISDEFASENFAKLTGEWREVPYRELIARHVEQDGDSIEPQLAGYMNELDESLKEIGERLIDEFNVLAQNQRWWSRPCGEIVSVMRARITEMMASTGCVASEPEQYALFQIIALNFARVVRDDSGSRAFAVINLRAEVERAKGCGSVVLASLAVITGAVVWWIG